MVDGGEGGLPEMLLDVLVEGGDLGVHGGAGAGIAELGEPGVYLCRLAVEAQGAGHLGDVVSRLPMS